VAGSKAADGEQNLLSHRVLLSMLGKHVHDDVTAARMGL
jgi:hypothetical protein